MDNDTIETMATVTASKKELTKEIKTFIVRAVNEALSDPDFGLELSENAKKRLRKSSVKRRTVSFPDIKKRYS